MDIWSYRGSKIQECIDKNTKKLKKIEENYEENKNDLAFNLEFLKKKKILSFMSEEQYIEEITIKRTKSIFNNKCKKISFEN